MKNYDLLIFDWDGTLMNSIEHIVDSLQYAMDKMQTPVLDRQSTGNIIGLGLTEAIQTLLPQHAHDDEFIEQFCDHYRAHYLDPDKATPLFQGALDTLNHLKQEGYAMAIATSKSRVGLDSVMQGLDVGHLFDCSRCADETRTKPYPDMLHEILQVTGVRARNTLMIGDSEYDMEMAANAKVDALAVSYGVHNLQRLYKHNPIAHIDAIHELPALLVSRQQSKQTS